MRIRGVLVSFGACLATAALVVTPASASNSWIHDGFYSQSGFGAGYSYAGLIVAANGTKVLGGQSGTGVACTASPSFIALDPNELNGDSVISVRVPHALTISAAGTFSYSGNVTLSAEDTQSTMSFTEPITIKGHFLKVHVIAHKTVAAIIDFYAPAICESATPRTFRDQWDVTDK
jgi:hypothetical protein